MSNNDNGPAQSTPEAELRKHITDPNVPKNEREWWAYHEISRLQEDKDGAYLERNQVVAALSKLFPAGTARTEIEGWNAEWHGCVYIDLPTGQVSWHYHDSHAELFAHLPVYAGKWDGHDTAEKYARLRGLAAAEPAIAPVSTREEKLREALNNLLEWVFAVNKEAGWNSRTTPDAVVAACTALADVSGASADS